MSKHERRETGLNTESHPEVIVDGKTVYDTSTNPAREVGTASDNPTTHRAEG